MREIGSEEFFKSVQYIKKALSLPFDKITLTMPLLSDNTLERQHKLEIQKLILNIQKKLDEKLYGMNESKEQVLLFLHDRLMNPFSKKQNVLCLQGEPGVGKTSMCLALSQVLGLPFEQISLGGKVPLSSY